MAYDVVTSARENAVAEHALARELGRPQDGCDHHLYPRSRPECIVVEALADPRRAEDNHGGYEARFGLHDQTDHNPARDLDIARLDASRESVADCWTPRECRQGEHSSTGR